MQNGCKATRQALNLMFLTNDQTHNGCVLQRVTWVNRIDVQTKTRRQEEEANWLYTTLSVSRDKSVSHQLQTTDLFPPVPNSLDSWTLVWVWLTRVTSVAGAGSRGSDDEERWREHNVTCHAVTLPHVNTAVMRGAEVALHASIRLNNANSVSGDILNAANIAKNLARAIKLWDVRWRWLEHSDDWPCLHCFNFTLNISH